MFIFSIYIVKFIQLLGCQVVSSVFLEDNRLSERAVELCQRMISLKKCGSGRRNVQRKASGGKGSANELQEFWDALEKKLGKNWFCRSYIGCLVKIQISDFLSKCWCLIFSWLKCDVLCFPKKMRSVFSSYLMKSNKLDEIEFLNYILGVKGSIFGNWAL